MSLGSLTDAELRERLEDLGAWMRSRMDHCRRRLDTRAEAAARRAMPDDEAARFLDELRVELRTLEAVARVLEDGSLKGGA